MGPAGCKQFLAFPHSNSKDIRVIVRLSGIGDISKAKL
jgi:hypothetical protein